MKFLSVTALSLVVAYSSPTIANDYASTQDILAYCQQFLEGANNYNAGMCFGMVRSVIPSPDETRRALQFTQETIERNEQIRHDMKAQGYTDDYINKEIIIFDHKYSDDFCIPQDTNASSFQNAQRIVYAAVNWIRNHPGRWHERFERLVYQAFLDTWPCKDPNVTTTPAPEPIIPKPVQTVRRADLIQCTAKYANAKPGLMCCPNGYSWNDQGQGCFSH